MPASLSVLLCLGLAEQVSGYTLVKVTNSPGDCGDPEETASYFVSDCNNAWERSVAWTCTADSATRTEHEHAVDGAAVDPCTVVSSTQVKNSSLCEHSQMVVCEEHEAYIDVEYHTTSDCSDAAPMIIIVWPFDTCIPTDSHSGKSIRLTQTGGFNYPNTRDCSGAGEANSELNYWLGEPCMERNDVISGVQARGMKFRKVGAAWTPTTAAPETTTVTTVQGLAAGAATAGGTLFGILVAAVVAAAHANR